MKSFFVADAPRFDNETVTSFFSIASLSVREKKGGGQYLALVLADKTGQLEARMWEEFADAVHECSEGCYVKAQGQISKYQGRFQITLTRMRSAAESEVEPADLCRHRASHGRHGPGVARLCGRVSQPMAEAARVPVP